MFSQEELIGLFLADDKSEFKSASELDDSTLKSIRSKYFKGTFVVPFIVSLISIAILNGVCFDYPLDFFLDHCFKDQKKEILILLRLYQRQELEISGIIFQNA